jgi:hypothetical protein
MRGERKVIVSPDSFHSLFILSRMSLEEFRAFVNNSGVEFDKLNNDDKIRYRVDFERSRQAVQPTGKCTFKQYLFIVNHIEYLYYIIYDCRQSVAPN